MSLPPETVERLFTRADGRFLLARWGRPLAPVVFGVEPETVAVLKGAFEAVCALTGHQMTETDPELGANLMVFFCRDWRELLDVPNLDRLVDGLAPLVERLEAAEANQYRVFRFDEAGAIRACFAFVRVDAHIEAVPAETLALNQAVQAMLLWSDAAFRDASPLAVANGVAVLRPDVAAVMHAAYDPVLPAVSHDPAHAHRVAARTGGVQ
ncbi:hypothetical protein [Jannaschia sp. W003]|uniref:hypothetical protein n=1 Tax=Jannaschia sp. W003 TaxID=2867012 RepID=UPI0021A3539F|nr:hypothetical protein [Jannaschia sp. W003]UWQ22533.1 hypothetical protein K3554_05775 [Jannaschia sp. W003]